MESLAQTGALCIALDLALERIAQLSPADPKGEFEDLRDQYVAIFKNADLPAALDLDHARIMRPAIETVENVFGRYQAIGMSPSKG